MTDVPPRLTGDDPMSTFFRECIWRPAAKKDDWRAFAIAGREGLGKSLTCASILEACYPDMTVDNIHFRAIPFLQDVAEQDYQPGMPIMSDETGVMFGKRSWYESEQIDANQALQTARDDNRILGSTAPALSDIDSQFIERFHYVFEVTSLSDGNYTCIKPYYINVDRVKNAGNRSEIYPRAKINGRIHRLEKFKVGPPSDELIQNYYNKKAQWKSDNYDDTIEKYEEKEHEPMTPKEIANEIINQGLVQQYIADNYGQKYVDKDAIAADYEIGESKAKRVKSKIRREVDEDVN